MTFFAGLPRQGMAIFTLMLINSLRTSSLISLMSFFIIEGLGVPAWQAGFYVATVAPLSLLTIRWAGEKLDRLSNATVQVKEWKGEVVFLHEIVPGAADRSYGIQVAKLAGLPSSVVERSKAVLSQLEDQDRRSPAESLIDELPLFAALTPTPSAATDPGEPDPLVQELDTIDPDDMTPREALEALYRLKAARSNRDQI